MERSQDLELALALAPEPNGRAAICLRSIGLVIALLLSDSYTLAGAQEPDPGRPERRYVLFQPGPAAPASVSPAASAKLTENPFQREFLYWRWVRPNDIDFASARPGDRVLVEVSDSESFELVLSQVNVLSNGSTLWYGGFAGSIGTSLYVNFLHATKFADKPTFHGASLVVPAQRRMFQVDTTEHLPGWAMLREIKPGTGTHLDNSNDTGGAEIRAKVQREAEEILRRQREAQEPK